MQANNLCQASSVIICSLLIVMFNQTRIVNAAEFGEGIKTRPVKCLLQVKGKTYLKGICKYDADKDGSFRLFGKDYFVYLNTIKQNKAEAFLE